MRSYHSWRSAPVRRSSAVDGLDSRGSPIHLQMAEPHSGSADQRTTRKTMPLQGRCRRRQIQPYPASTTVYTATIHSVDGRCRVITVTRKAWQNLACSPPGIAVSSPDNSSETKLSPDRPTKLSQFPLIAAVPSSGAAKHGAEGVKAVRVDRPP